MATVNLGAIKFNWKGAYNNATAYVADDVVSSGGNSYVCILASTGNAVSNGTYWSLMAQAGTNGTNGSNGTDLTTVLTTESDIVYRDGSGLQRLAKGTASQQLRMNSGATAPEWFTAGSAGFTRGTTTTPTLNPVAWSSIPSGTSMIYLSFMRVSPNSNTNIGVQLGDAGGIEGTGYYQQTIRHWGANANESTDGFFFYSENAAAEWQGSILMTHLTNNIWISRINVSNYSGFGGGMSQNITGNGYKQLSGELTQLRFVADTGSMDGASAQANIIYM